MKGLGNQVVNHLTGRDLKTVLHPTTIISNDVALATDKERNLHAYKIDMRRVEFTENNSIITKLPKKSNIKEIVDDLDSMKKRVKGDKLVSKGDDYMKTIWVDSFNRLFATKIEKPDYISIVIRGDVANQFFLEKKLMVQCATATCDALFPTKLDIDLKRFVAKDPTGRS